MFNYCFKCIFAIGLFTMLWGITANANAASYLGLQWAIVDHQQAGFVTQRPHALLIRAGDDLNDFFAIEVRLGTGITDVSTKKNNEQQHIELDYFLGAYLVAHLPVTEQFSFYGTAGLSKAKGSGEKIHDAPYLPYATTQTTRHRMTEEGLAYGVGMQANVTQRVSITLEYLSYLDTSALRLQATSGGLLWRF